MILVDATYKLLDWQMPVYLLFCIVGDGLSKIVAMYTLAQETKGVEVFKKHSPSWSQTKVIMYGKISLHTMLLQVVWRLSANL